jgi:hypothetical protein
MIPLEVDGSTYSTSRLHPPLSYAVRGEEASQGNDGRMKTPPDIKFGDNRSIDRAEAPNGGHSVDAKSAPYVKHTASRTS